MGHSRYSAGRRRFLASAGGVGITALAGCFGGDDPDGEDDGPRHVDPDDREINSEWVTAISSEASFRSPYTIAEAGDATRLDLLVDGAYELDENDEFYSLWVEDYENVGNEEYVFTLRDTLEWGADYGAMTADDWVWHYHNVITPALEGENWANHATAGHWEGIVDVEAEDEHTFRMTLEDPNPLFIQSPAMWGQDAILPRTLVEPYYEDWQDGESGVGRALNESDAVSTYEYAGNLGPYTFERREPEDRFVAVRNEDYYRRGTGPDEEDWADAPYFEQYTIRVIQDDTTRLNELEAGNLSALDSPETIPADHADRFRGDEDVTVVTTETPFVRILAYNQRANGWEQLRNREVRRALSMAVDKETIVEDIFGGNASIAQTFQPAYSEFYDDSQVEAFGVGESYDPDGARSILEAELSSDYGYDGDDLLGPDGEQVELTLYYGNHADVVRDTGSFIAHELEDIGFAVDRKARPFETVSESVLNIPDDDGTLHTNPGNREEYTSTADWDLYYGLGLNTFPRSPYRLEPYFTREGSVNFYGYHPEADIDGMVETAMDNDDLEAMRADFADVFGTLSEEQPVNFVLFRDEIHGYHEEVVHTEEAAPSWGYKDATWWKTDDPFA
ncbi:ABC transporter substrate-binding protein [Natrialbaceae archaeon A-gly3]